MVAHYQEYLQLLRIFSDMITQFLKLLSNFLLRQIYFQVQKLKLNLKVSLNIFDDHTYGGVFEVYRHLLSIQDWKYLLLQLISPFHQKEHDYDEDQNASSFIFFQFFYYLMLNLIIRLLNHLTLHLKSNLNLGNYFKLFALFQYQIKFQLKHFIYHQAMFQQRNDEK